MNGLAPLRLLLVDDNPHDRGLVIRQLRQSFEDIDARHVLDSAELVSALTEGPFDVVITDYQLRWSNGITVLDEVKSRYPNCPVIMFTATGNEQVAVEAMKRGLDDYVIKNLQHLSRLPIAITAALEKTTTRQRMEQLQAQLDDLLSCLGFGVFRCTLGGELIDCNPALERLLNATSAQDAADKWDAFLSSTGFQLAHAATRLSPGEPADFEVLWPAEPQAEKHLHLRLTRGQLADLTPVIEGVIEDVTARRKADQEQRALMIAAERLTLLTARERQVFEAVVAGHPNKVTARQLHITEKTVEKHRARIMKKLAARSVADLVRLDVFEKSQRR